MSRPQPPAGFITMAPGIYINLALAGKAVMQPDDFHPNVILIFGWMGARTRHLQHYSQKYSELYPRAVQIIIKCEPSFFWTSERGEQHRLLPIVEALESLGCLPSLDDRTQAPTRAPPRVLVHSFSNGGGVQLTSLGRLLAAKYGTVPPSGYLVSALIMDSAPSIGNFRSIGLAFSIAIRNPVTRYVVLIVIYILHAFRLSLQAIFGIETRVTRYIKMLLQPRLLPWMNSQTPRLYVFSKKDELVPWQAIQQHVDDARASGFNVRCEVYDESAHVAHMRLDPKRYWASVQDLWQAACRENQVKAVEATENTIMNT